MSLIVEYACTGCGDRRDFWVAHPIPPTRDCAACGQGANRRFGGGFLSGRAEPPSTGGNPASGPSCRDFPDVPGICSLTPTAARSLAARLRGDTRALEREMAHQEEAISAGRLDPTASLVTPYHGHRQHTTKTADLRGDNSGPATSTAGPPDNNPATR
ncbi:hypothetical protein AB0I53_30415 [Saccharopolyspora sp. NPDC050389]|uniref:hypothetical protein n=1 Tax=Saccharopolyspora sp. NPDC050389 TaxID=3155516 RepID=UPI0033D71DF4